MNIMLILLCLFIFSSVASFGDPPEQPATKSDNPPSAEPNKRLVVDEQPITLAMIDGPDRILADLPAAPQWFRDKNWLALETDGARSMQDAVSGEPVVDEPTTALTAVDLMQAIQQRQTKKELEDDSNKEDKGDAEITPISPRLKQLLTDLGDATDGSSLFTFNHDVSKLAYVSDQGLNVFDLKSKQTKTIPAESPNHLVGKLDWVYQEELYGRGNFKGFWWQPDGDQIAFLELDETPLTPFVVMDHLPVLGKSEVTNYPKAGDSNPLVRVGVTSAAEPSKIQWIDLSAYKDEEIVVSAVTWSQDGSQLMLQIQNREQTWLDLIATDAQGQNGRVLFRDSTPAWIESPGDPILLNNGDFIWRSPRTGYSHLYRYDKDGKLLKAITEGEWGSPLVDWRRR